MFEYEGNTVNEFGTDDKTNLENAAPDLLKALEELYNHNKIIIAFLD